MSMLGTLHFRSLDLAARRGTLLAGTFLCAALAPGCDHERPTAAPSPSATIPAPPGGAPSPSVPAASSPPPVHWSAQGPRPASAPTESADRTGSATGSATSSNGEPLPAVTFDAPAASADESRWKTNAEQARQESPPLRALVDVRLQSLTVFSGQRLVARFPISTAARGIGSTEASYRTPLGRHRVHQKFGADAPIGTVFRSRINTHTVAPILTDPVDVEEDLILTRILWLDGLEPGLNRGPGIDSRERFIYIHGTNEEGLIGTPVSHGCVRMRNRDVIELFDLLPCGAEVEIVRGGA